MGPEHTQSSTSDVFALASAREPCASSGNLPSSSLSVAETDNPITNASTVSDFARFVLREQSGTPHFNERTGRGTVGGIPTAFSGDVRA